MVSRAIIARRAGPVSTVTMLRHAFLGSAVVRMADVPSRDLDASVTLVGMATIVIGPCVLYRVTLERVLMTRQSASVMTIIPVRRLGVTDRFVPRTGNVRMEDIVLMLATASVCHITQGCTVSILLIAAFPAITAAAPHHLANASARPTGRDLTAASTWAPVTTAPALEARVSMGLTHVHVSLVTLAHSAQFRSARAVSMVTAR